MTNNPTVSSVLPSTIYSTLRTRILSQADASGTLFTESAVALEFGVARPTAKMAIERLVTEGLLQRGAHQAARIPELSRDDIVDLFENRAIVEGAALASLANDGTIPAEALAAHHLISDGVGSDAPFAAADIDFHRALVTGQHSARLSRMHAMLMGEIELCIGQVQANHLRTAADVVPEHQGILDAVTAGNALLAEQLTREHIAESRDRLLMHFDDQHSDNQHTDNQHDREQHDQEGN